MYGDRGNLLVLQKRAEWYGLAPVCQDLEPGEALPMDADLVLLGGGQDADQARIAAELLALREPLQRLYESGAVILAVCGGYQLLGTHYQTASGEELAGLGLLSLSTQANSPRISGNLIAESAVPGFGTLVGFENHAGRTQLADGLQPLAQVKQGGGNNGRDQTEGVYAPHHQSNGLIIGTYLHSFLPRNVQVADALLARISGQKLPGLADDQERAAHQHALQLKY